MNGRRTFLSLFSGIGGFDLALERAGWRCASQVEIDAFCGRVLGRRFPTIGRRGDVRAYGSDTQGEEARRTPIDLLCGGFPCQDLSVAGRRAGLRGERSGLFFEFMRVARELRPHWLLIENVPGWFSSHQGRDFATALVEMDERGYDPLWITLDSRHFGVPQRRRRVFLVGHLRGACRCAPEVLFEPEGGSGDPAAGGEAGARIASPFTRSAGHVGFQCGDENVVTALRHLGTGGPDDNEAQGRHLIAFSLRGRGEGADVSEDGTGRGTPLVLAPAVRRLTPLECERLQSFPDGWTCLCGATEAMLAKRGITEADWRRSDWRTLRLEGHTTRCRCPDGPRYRALGNAVTVSVVEWIARRMQAAHLPGGQSGTSANPPQADPRIPATPEAIP